ncbi:serine hydrolase-like protein 2 isoform X2 [Nilaparvata lugens]|uniref:serine hydrolase-like protein 2 isoform X2 n=1 Tax=Nilaparvata lugens TaxID=108931 RepID=UPI00193EA3D7|nr:serine hydrolase-like protein 2 isoform X2 [Nilaparvata lugens]
MHALRRSLLRCGIQARNISTKEVTEVTIPVPWGHLAGKLWGNSDKQPILALHGWQDNAATFDYLIENLNIDRPVLAIDFPGNGFSSPTFPFFPYHEIDLIACVRWVQTHYNWEEKITILGHSMGAMTGFLFSGIYPEMVNGTISLDFVKPVEQDRKERADKMGALMDRIITLMKRDDSDVGCSKKELEDRWRESAGLSQKAVEKLMERGCKEVKPGLFNYTRDSRLKAWQMHRWECSENMYIASKITCPVLLVKGKNSKFFDWSISCCPKILDQIKSSAKSFEMVTVEGSHHLQIDNPKEVAEVIEKFLAKLEHEN